MPRLPITKISKILICLGAGLCLSVYSRAGQEQVLLTQENFLVQAFAPANGKIATLWLTAPVQSEAARILGHTPAQMRQRYWTDGTATAWILEEVGKEELITAGFLIANGQLQQTRLLVFRESRGWEIKYPSFLKQFDGAALTAALGLSTQIDNISGATLSVNAMNRMARLALYYDRVAREQKKSASPAPQAQR